MAKFQFKMETLLRHRKNVEENERSKLSRIHFQIQSERNHFRELESKQQETLKELANKRSTAAHEEEITLFYPFLERLRWEMEQSDKRVAQLERELQVQQAALVEASKSKKVLDTLKNRKRKEFFAVQEKEEQKIIDEIVTTRFGQKDQ